MAYTRLPLDPTTWDLSRQLRACQVLHSEDRGQRLLVFTATPGTPDADRLELLSVVGGQFTG